jgi:hypothetical protein
MTANKLTTIASIFALCMTLAATAYAIDAGTQGGAAAQAQVGTPGTGANAQAGTGGATAGAQAATPGMGTGTQANVKASAGVPLTGALTVKDPTLRTFSIAGQTQVYVAPETVDLNQFEGENVTVTFDPNGRVTNIQVDREG